VPAGQFSAVIGHRRLRIIATSFIAVATACTVAFIINAHSNIDMIFSPVVRQPELA
jgi:hypothetical protein